MIRHASGISPEELSLQDAFMDGQRQGLVGIAAGLNPYQLGTPEYAEWERGRFTAFGTLLLRKTA